MAGGVSKEMQRRHKGISRQLWCVACQSALFISGSEASQASVWVQSPPGVSQRGMEVCHSPGAQSHPSLSALLTSLTCWYARSCWSLYLQDCRMPNLFIWMFFFSQWKEGLIPTPPGFHAHLVIHNPQTIKKNEGVAKQISLGMIRLRNPSLQFRQNSREAPALWHTWYDIGYCSSWLTKTHSRSFPAVQSCYFRLTNLKIELVKLVVKLAYLGMSWSNGKANLVIKLV